MTRSSVPLYVCLFCILLSPGLYTFGQEPISFADSSLTSVSPKYLHSVTRKAESYSRRIASKTEKTLERLARWEERIHRILQKNAPSVAERLFANDQYSFARMLQLYRDGTVHAGAFAAKYDQYRDKLTTSIGYLNSEKKKLAAGVREELEPASEATEEMNRQADAVDIVAQMIKERKKQLLNEAMRYAGNGRLLKKVNKETWYYAESLANYKQLLHEPGKLETLVVNLLEKIPAFREFAQRNSMVAALFPAPGQQGTPYLLSGMQTRAQITGLIQQQMGNSGANVTGSIMQHIQSAQNQLQQVKNRLKGADGQGANTEMPDFKVNTQKSKTFLQRLDFGVNVQTQKTSYFFPATSDWGISAGYKLNEKSVIGVGGSYKLGLGKGWNHIRLTHEGAGLRSFIDWKIKGSFWLSGGYELNYRAAIRNISALYDFSGWQQSGLVGLTKTISLSSKFFKRTKVQLLYDFMANKQVPAAQPLVFRLGYGIR